MVLSFVFDPFSGLLLFDPCSVRIQNQSDCHTWCGLVCNDYIYHAIMLDIAQLLIRIIRWHVYDWTVSDVLHLVVCRIDPQDR
jgi:hypothetical protein